MLLLCLAGQAGSRPGGSATLPATSQLQAGSRPAPGRRLRAPPRPPASHPGRGQAGSRPASSATLPAFSLNQAGSRPAPGRRLRVPPSLLRQLQTGARPGPGRVVRPPYRPRASPGRAQAGLPAAGQICQAGLAGPRQGLGRAPCAWKKPPTVLSLEGVFIPLHLTPAS